MHLSFVKVGSICRDRLAVGNPRLLFLFLTSTPKCVPVYREGAPDTISSIQVIKGLLESLLEVMQTSSRGILVVLCWGFICPLVIRKSWVDSGTSSHSPRMYMSRFFECV
jgi:hypothetical protein